MGFQAWEGRLLDNWTGLGRVYIGGCVNCSMEVRELILKEGLRRGLRAETIKTYSYAVGKFLRSYGKQPHEAAKEDIERYVVQLIKWNRAGSTINVYLHALKFFYEQILGKRLTVKVPLFKNRKRLAECLSQEEVVRFFQVIKESKHRLILFFTYGSGFRVSEVVKLKVGDLELEAGYGWVRDGKGGKERMFIIPDRLRDELRRWIRERALEPEDWLFKGYKGSHYSDSGVRKIVEEAAGKAGISKQVSPHTLRHSFATHLLENGYSLIEVNRLLGHSRLETTMVYTHMAKPKMFNIKSPLDDLPSEKLFKQEGS